jgi:hypothetical protein
VLRPVLALLLGLGLGALLGAGLPLGAARGEQGATAPPAPRRAPPPASPPDCAAQDRVLGSAWAELEQAEARLQGLQQQIEDLIGPRPAFGSQPARWQPERVEDEVLAALPGSGAELAWIDCSEAPCIAVLSVPAEGLSEAGDAVRQALGSGYPWEGFGVGSGFYVTVPLGERSRDAQLDLREEFIIQELTAAGRSGQAP